MEGGFVTGPRRVLVIDGPSETATVLKAVLEPHGAIVDRTRSHVAGDRFQSVDQPDVVVVDVDGPTASVAPVWTETPHVVLGAAWAPLAGRTSRFLQKPFEFPELVQAVQDLLAGCER
jgi:DNA-binding NtrC family response regulator